MKKRSSKVIEEIYQKKDPVEHILLRPDTYIGSTEESKEKMWIFDEEKQKFIFKEISYVQGMFKIYDEIIVNAADNYHRDLLTKKISVTIDEKTGMISCYNDGTGIPILIHKGEQLYVAEMIFGQLLTGSNFNDTEKKVTGGRNGYGAKLTNIYSTFFQVECSDYKREKILTITWRNNMSVKEPLEFKSYKGSKDYVKISFIPDFTKFGQTKLIKDMNQLFQKRIYDLAGVIGSKVKIYLNENLLNLKNFSEYCKMFLKDPNQFLVKYKQDRWEVVVTAAEKGEFQHVSIVNSINTYRGGVHVNYIRDQIVDQLIIEIKKKKPTLKIKNQVIRNNLWIFINCQIENPTFDTQTKEFMTLKKSSFGSTCDFSKDFYKQLIATELIDMIILEAEQKENAQLKKVLKGNKRKKLIGMEKLEDANKAGTKDSDKCLLILTEGDSAKSLAMSGLEIVGRDYFGVFPLRGKLLNVREANNSKILKNAEIQDVIKIMGLQVGVNYTDTKSLRYGGILIMTDQDVDGSHIKGLIINFVAHFWPSLIINCEYIKQFITPIIKCFHGKQVKSFFSINAYKNWAQENDTSKWRIKYYKGLGTSTPEEAQEYFNDFNFHKIDFVYQGNEDLEKIKLLFDKKMVEQRKQWLTTYNQDSNVDFDIKKITYKDFIDKEMIHFSMYDNQRSIPHLLDGLKPGKRKILYGCFLKNLTGEIKVAQLTGYISEKANYHHGEMSLQQTIVNMAQSFVGSNNINLLEPIGQFGTRAQGGKDAASSRYIFTKLNPITRLIFPEDDDHCLNYQLDDGDIVEPEFYMPIIPMILVNGAEGIGSGWSTFIPNYNPREIVQNLLRRLDGEEFLHMDPYYKNYTGAIITNDKGYDCKGIYELDMINSVIKILELPIGKWTRQYKSFIEEMMEKENQIEDMLEFHKTDTVHFELKVKYEKLNKWYNEGKINQKFKLIKSYSLQNMVLFDKDHLLKRYKRVIDIMEEFYQIRLQYYSKRKEYLMSKLERELKYLENKVRFITFVIEEKIILKNKPKKNIFEELIGFKFTKEKEMPQIKSSKIRIQNSELVVKENKQEDQEEEVFDFDIKQFNYLLSMSLLAMSKEEVIKLKDLMKKKEEELQKIIDYQEKQMWRDDLTKFLEHLERIENKEQIKKDKADEKLMKKFNQMQKDKKKKRKKRGEQKVEKKPKKQKIQAQTFNLEELKQKDPLELSLDEQVFLFNNINKSSSRQKMDISDEEQINQQNQQYIHFQNYKQKFFLLDKNS